VSFDASSIFLVEGLGRSVIGNYLLAKHILFNLQVVNINIYSGREIEQSVVVFVRENSATVICRVR